MTRRAGGAWAAAAAALFILAGAGLVILTQERGGVAAEAGAAVAGADAEVVQGLTPPAEAAAAALRRTSAPPVAREAAREATPPLTEEAVEIEILALDAPVTRRPRHAPYGPTRPWAALAGQVRLAEPLREPFEVSIVAGLNAGRSVKVGDSARYALDELWPGVNLVQLTVEKRRILRQVKLVNGATAKLDFDWTRARPAKGTLTDQLTGTPLADGGVEIDGERTPADGKGEFTTRDVAEGDSIFYAEAPGFELRRADVKWTSFRRGPPKPFEFQLRRSTRVRVSFDGPADPESPPIAVAVPRRQGPFSVAFEKVCVVAGKKGERDIVLDGLPCEEAFRVFLFCGSGVQIHPFRELDALEPTSSRTREARFLVEPRKRLRGTVWMDGVPVEGARVKLETADVAEATEKWFGASAFARHAFPVLPCARREMETGKNGEFAFEVADLLHPATLSIDKLGLPSFREGVPTGQLNLGVIDLTEAAEDVKPKDPPPGIALEFADERPRKLALTIVPTGDAAPKRTDWSLTGRRSPSFRVPAGNYRVRLGAGSAVKTVDVRVDGETVVAADLEGPASR